MNEKGNDFGESLLKVMMRMSEAGFEVERDNPILATSIRYWIGEINRARLEDMEKA